MKMCEQEEQLQAQRAEKTNTFVSFKTQSSLDGGKGLGLLRREAAVGRSRRGRGRRSLLAEEKAENHVLLGLRGSRSFNTGDVLATHCSRLHRVIPLAETTSSTSPI